MTLLTKTSIKRFSSTNPFAFNLREEESLTSPKTSPFQRNFVLDNAENILSNALHRIEANKYSPLCLDMIKNSCNKSVTHNYTQVYHEILERVRSSLFTFIEIGIGTPHQEVPSAMSDNYSYGASLRAWRSYFKNEEMVVFGGDIDPRVLIQENKIETHYINQLNPSSVISYLTKSKTLDIGIDFILDDGLHEFRSNISLLISIWPHLNKNGIYIIEDMSIDTYNKLIKFIEDLSLGADCVAYELPSEIKADNRIIILQKN